MSGMNRRDFLTSMCALGAAGCLPAVGTAASGGGGGRPNVLFVAVDDLRPQLGCYGQTQMISPNIDRLAGQGVMFERAFCSVPVCGASRASLLSGLRPLRDRFVNYHSWVEKDAPEVVTLPRLFKNNGYKCVSLGKVYHHRTDDTQSWSEEPWRAAATARHYLIEENKQLNEKDWPESSVWQRGPAWEAADVEDDAYPDGAMASRAIAELEKYAASGESFFLATGFDKPHLPFNAPKKYWDLLRPPSA